MVHASITGDKPGKPKADTSWLRLMKARMQSELRLAVISLFCLCSIIIIGSFAVYRFSVRDWLIGAVDLLIVAVFLALTILAWHPQWTRLATNLTAAIASLAGLTVVLLLGISHMWLLSTLIANFLMAERRVALVVSAAVIASIATQPTIFADTTEYATFIAVATMISLFSMIFASRVDSQHGQLTDIAARDGLTGAFNRRAMDHDLHKLVSHRSVDGRPHCLAILDLDNFKELNDRCGHEAGDDILIQLAATVRACTREKDRFYRYGGEEFVLLLPRTSLDGARVALRNLREAMAQDLVAHCGLVTASFGLAEYHSGETAADWLRRADQALLEAKHAGKNRVVTAS